MSRHTLLTCLLLLPGCSSPSGPPDSASEDAARPADSGDDVDSGSEGDSGTGGDSGTEVDAASDAATPLDAPGPGDTGSDAALAGDAGAPVADHLVISEIGVSGAGYEFFEIWNPTGAAIALDDYYVSDNAAYHAIAAGSAWSPMGTPQTDFLARFPPGATLAAGAGLVVATSPLFEGAFGRCPDFVLMATALSCATGSASAMVAPTNGGIGTMGGSLLSNDREMLVLFRWSGTDAVVRDVDYVTWGSTFDAATRVDKTAVGGYAADTPPASQRGAEPPPATQSLERCADEVGETAAGGNGITGHDETSEHLDLAFRVVTTPTPGARTVCP